MPETLFLRLLAHEDKAAAMAEALAAVREGDSTNPAVHLVDPHSFRQVPGSPFAYWVSEALRRKFTELPPFESDGRQVRLGDHPSDDFRYLRLSWEVPAGFTKLDWRPYQKGGEYSPYYYDVHLVVDWDASRQTYRGFYGRPGRRNERPSNYQFFFRPGLTWPRRTQGGFGLRASPAGCVFADKGPTAFAPPTQLRALLAIANSVVFFQFVTLQMAFGAYETGVIQRTPIPDLNNSNGERLAELATCCIELKRALDSTSETSHAFHLPALLQATGDMVSHRLTGWIGRVNEVERQFAACQREIDDLAYCLYGIVNEDRAAIERSLHTELSVGSALRADLAADDVSDEEETPASTVHTPTLVADLLSYALGCALGRWDIRIALDPSLAPKLADPFAPLPVCSPGMLVGPDGLPAQPNRIASEAWLRARPDAITLPEEGIVGRPTIRDDEYPLRVAWDGILVDDPDHPDDVVRRVREALEVVWGERAEAVEREACGLLGVKGLRDYFRNPRGFFDEHIRRYSKSRRKAPIYWLLQSDRRNYGLWLSYHRLDQDTLFKALQGYVAPKLAREESRLRALRRALEGGGASGAARRQQERQVDEQEALVLELTRFQETLRGVANLHLAPDLDDGVLLSIAPLHALVPWKEAKQAWQELLAGKYAWSTMGRRMRGRTSPPAPPLVGEGSRTGGRTA